MKNFSILICISLGVTHVAAGSSASLELLSPCPESPNCVSSLSGNEKQFVEPFKYSGSIEKARQMLVSILENAHRARLVKIKENYLHAEFRSLLFRFVDDVQFFLPADEPIIHIKSASRSGYYDFGVNRRRVEQLRAEFMRALALMDDTRPMASR
ncbi:MAG: DUF1499 domain-containing protein [Desulfobacterales bacterium]